MGIHIYKQTHLNSKLQGLSTVLLPSMNHKLPVFLKCAKLGKVFIAEREVRIKVCKRGMMKKELSRIRLQEIEGNPYSTKYSTMKKIKLYIRI